MARRKQPEPFSPTAEPTSTEPGQRRTFDPASFAVTIGGKPVDIKLTDVSWETAADDRLDALAAQARIVRQEGETDDALRERVRTKLGQRYTAEGDGGDFTLKGGSGSAPRMAITLLGQPNEPNVFLNGMLQMNGTDVHALNDEGAPVFDPSILVAIGDRAQVNYSNGLQEFYNRVNPGRWKLAGDRRAPRRPEVIQLNAEFRDAQGDRVKLGSPVQCDILTPRGSQLTYTTAQGQVREEREGRYTLQFTAQEPGTYRVRWTGAHASLDTELVVTGTGGTSAKEVAVEPPEPHWDAETRQRILDELEVDAADALRDLDATLTALDSDDPNKVDSSPESDR